MDATPLTDFTDLFQTLQVFLSCSEDVHVVLGLSSFYLFINFFHFVDLVLFFFFSGQITIRIDFHRLFDTIHTCSTMVWGLSSHYFY